MKREFFDNALQYIQKELGKGRGYSPGQIQKITEALVNESDKALEEVFDRLLLNANTLPTPQQLIDAVRQSAAARREKQAAEMKKEYQKPLVADTEFAKGSLCIIKQFYPDDAKVNYENILADAQSMAIRFPGSDWPNIYLDWQNEWTKAGKLDPF